MQPHSGIFVFGKRLICCMMLRNVALLNPAHAPDL